MAVLKYAATIALTLTALIAPTTATAAPVGEDGPVPVRSLPSVNGQSAAQSEQDRYLAYIESPEARDLRGVEDSLYEGKFYRSSMEDKRKCIVERESSGYYTVQGGGGNRYYGAYQMSRELAVGATWMMLPEHKKLVGEKEAKRILADLRETPPNEWSRYWQDAAFYTIANWESTGSGLSHWAGGRWYC